MPTHRVRERLEGAALVLGGLLVVAFAASFVLGLLRPATNQPALAGTEPSGRTTLELPATARGRVEVLNGSGRAGLARHATERLRSGGFDVVFFGNAPAARDSSEVLDRVGRPEIARDAAARLGIPRVRTARDSTLFVDATIVLGGDFRPAEPAVGVAADSSWTGRLRRWLGRD